MGGEQTGHNLDTDHSETMLPYWLGVKKQQHPATTTTTSTTLLLLLICFHCR